VKSQQNCKNKQINKGATRVPQQTRIILEEEDECITSLVMKFFIKKSSVYERHHTSNGCALRMRIKKFRGTHLKKKNKNISRQKC
jgi:hypothetical protein